MRTAFIRSLEKVAARDTRVMLVVGDLGFGVVEPFAKRWPDRYVNAGVAEQNMTSIAAGLAMMGRVVFTYSIANFPTLRCLEQIRNDVCYHRLPVKVVAVGGGFAYGALGMSHHATEDLAIFRSLPEMTVVAPGDPVEVEHAVPAIVRHPGPVYLRLGRAGEARLHGGPISFELGKAIRVREGRKLTLISSGGMLEATLAAAERLEGARVLSMHTVRPIDSEAILRAARETRLLVTIEEHGILGGLGGAVAEVLAGAGSRTPLKRLGVPPEFPSRVGDQAHMRRSFGLDAEGIVSTVQPLLGDGG